MLISPRIQVLLSAIVLLGASARADWDMGPLYDEFSLTLSTGNRHEALGPLFQHEVKGSQKLWAVPPLFSYVNDPVINVQELDILYPLITLDRFGPEYRFQIIQLFAFAGGKTQDEEIKRRFTLFPLIFHQSSDNPEFDYTAVVPFYGTTKNRLFRDEINFVLWPMYVQSRKRDIVTDNYLYPIFHIRRGNELHGWQAWPLIGAEHRNPTFRTNIVEEIEVVGGHEKLFVLWPIFFKQTTGIGTENPERQISVLPLFTSMRSPKRDSITAPWPIGLTCTRDREKKFKEFGAPWPLIVFARGEGKYMSRVWPLYSHAHGGVLESRFVLWPVYRYNRLHSPPLDRERTRILLFLYSDIAEKNTETGNVRRRRDFWPFFTLHRDFNGDERLQVLSLIEPILPNNKSIERNYSPLWSIWRSEKNKKTGAESQSFLWNLYRREVTPESKKISAIFGLFQRQTTPDAASWRIFYVPLGKQIKETDLR